MSRYIEVRFICPDAADKEQVVILEGWEHSIEDIRTMKQKGMDALGCGGRHTILSVGEVDRAHAVLTNRKQGQEQEPEYYFEPDGPFEDDEPEYMYYEDDNQSAYWDDLYADEDPYLPYGDEDPR